MLNLFWSKTLKVTLVLVFSSFLYSVHWIASRSDCTNPFYPRIDKMQFPAPSAFWENFKYIFWYVLFGVSTFLIGGALNDHEGVGKWVPKLMCLVRVGFTMALGIALGITFPWTIFQFAVQKAEGQHSSDPPRQKASPNPPRKDPPPNARPAPPQLPQCGICGFRHPDCRGTAGRPNIRSRGHNNGYFQY